MKTSILSSNGKSQLEAIEQEIHRKHTRLNDESKDKGRFFGRQNVPLPKQPINHYIRFIVEGYKVIFQEAKRDIEKISSDMDSTIEQLDDRISQFTEVSRHLTYNLAILDKELPKDTTGYPWSFLPYAIVAVIFMLAAETGFNGVAFQIFGQSLFFSVIMAVGVSASIMLLFHGYRKTLALAKTPATRWLIILGWVVFYTVVFYFLAQLRMDYLKAVDSAEEISPVMFILVNWLLLLATGYVLSKFPTWEALKVKLTRKQMEKNIADKARQKAETERELAEMQTYRRAVSIDYGNMPKYETNMRDWINSLARQSVSDFLHENIQYRTDGNSSFGNFDVDDPLQQNLQITTP
ncbi:MAG: hypothetical protein K9J17_15935 [Flavobacteriales bacterium]|nr:hypothetical protein [Flavobacteriales bacterium]